ncbi:MAG: transposase [Candidatus Hydrothermarchaeales archaeon]
MVPVVPMKGITNNRLDKAHFMADLFERFEESGLPVREFCRVEGVHTSKFYYWRGRFLQEGRKGLVDKRRGRAHKATKPVRSYIQGVKMRDPLKSASDICRLVENKFGKKLTDRHVQRILKELGLNDPVGRKPGKPVKKTTD